MKRASAALSCEQIREAVSALLDREESDVGDERLATHLDACDDCRQWRTQARLATAAVIQPVVTPDITVRILTAVAGDAGVTERNLASRGRRQVLRLALAASAVSQLLLALPLLVMAPSETGARLGWEAAALAIAVSAGFCYAAWRPSAAPVMLLVAGVLALCLIAGGAREVISDPRSVGYHVGHLVTVLQAGLLWALVRTPMPGLAPSSTTARV